MAQSKSSGSHYALTAIGVGLLVLGVVMAIWNLVPGFGSTDSTGSTQGNSSNSDTGSASSKSKTFSVAYVLVGSGIALLLLVICLSIRSKRKRRQAMEDARVPQEESTVPQVNGESQEPNPPRYSAPSYEEVMRIGYPTSNTVEMDGDERIPVSLPSYESLTELDESLPTRPNAGTAKGEQPQRTNSRSGKEKKPLNVRRIKSDKLHLKEFRLNLSGQSHLPQNQTIEPLTPPPQYDAKPFDGTQPT
ncbi:transmembrane protein 51 [Rhinophrynus dorsalis]